MKSKKTKYAPLFLVDYISAKYGKGVWEDLEKWHMNNGKAGYPVWESWCYAPSYAAVEVLSDAVVAGAVVRNKDEDDDRELLFKVISDAQIVAAVAPWRKDKQVYAIDPDLLKALMGQANEYTSIPSEVLLRLPHRSIYVDFGDHAVGCLEGMFIHLEHDIEEGWIELRLLLLIAGETICIPICIDDEDLCDDLNESMELAIEQSKELIEHNKAYGIDILQEFRLAMPDYDESTITNFVSGLLQVALYFCSARQDIEENKTQQSVYRKSEAIKDKFSEIRRWDLGYNEGTQIRRFRESQNEECKNATTKPAQVRKGRWHHAWTGKGAEKRLRLAWLSPTMLGWDKADE